ncbi:MAG: HEAT repeat domain-containing protein, partial [Planctomycetes bacterium]|nr:HEAT repeat domain-containing protein [Planctomycetota bacterium]
GVADSERAFAALALGVLGDGDASQALTDIVRRGRGERDIASAALYALGLLGDARSQVFLEYFVLAPGHDDVLRSVAAQALAYSGRSESVDTFARLLKDPDVNVRRSAAIAFGRIDFVSAFRRDLESAQAELKSEFSGDGLSPAAAARFEGYLSRMRLKADEDELRLNQVKKHVVETLLDAGLSDADIMVRNFSALSLGQIGGEPAEAALIDLVDNAGNDSHRAFASLALALMPSADGRDAIRRNVIRQRIDADTRAAMLLALGLLEDQEISGYALNRLRSLGHADLAAYSAIALGLIDEQKASRPLREVVLGQSHPELKRPFGLALGLLGLDRTIEDLGSLLDSGASAETRIRAAAALSAIRDHRSIKQLVSGAQSRKRPPKDLVLAAYVRAIGVLGERGDLPVLSGRFRDLNYLTPVPVLVEFALL